MFTLNETSGVSWGRGFSTGVLTSGATCSWCACVFSSNTLYRSDELQQRIVWNLCWFSKIHFTSTWKINCILYFIFKFSWIIINFPELSSNYISWWDISKRFVKVKTELQFFFFSNYSLNSLYLLLYLLAVSEISGLYVDMHMYTYKSIPTLVIQKG